MACRGHCRAMAQREKRKEMKGNEDKEGNNIR